MNKKTLHSAGLIFMFLFAMLGLSIQQSLTPKIKLVRILTLLIRCIVLGLILIASPGSVWAQTELLEDPSFEEWDGTIYDANPLYWTEVPLSTSIDRYPVTVRTGSVSVRFSDPTTAYTGSTGRGIRSKNQASVTGGRYYNVGCWGYLREESTGEPANVSWVWVSVEWFQSDGTTPCDPAQSPTVGVQFSSFSTWTEFKTENIKAPTDAAKASVYIRCMETTNYNNDIYVDDAYLGTAIDKLVFTASDAVIPVNTKSDVFTVQTQDAGSVAYNVGTAATINLSSDSAGTPLFDIGSETWDITSITIVSGEATANFYYKDSAEGTPTITAAESPSQGWTDASVQVTITVPAPSVTITDLGTWNSGDVTITYKMIDAQSDECNISQTATSGIEYSTDQSSWTDCTQGTGGDGFTGLTSTPSPGTEHTFVWASGTNLSGQEDGSVWIRIRPNDGTYDATSWQESNSFGIDNKAPTGAGCSSPADLATKLSTKPTLTGTASDSGHTPISYYFLLSTDSGFSGGLQNSGWQSADTTWVPAIALSLNTDYWWKVMAKDEEGNTSDYGSPYKFTTLAFQDVVINEIAWMGTKANTEHEWVELYNSCGTSIDLTGWKFYDGNNCTLSGTIGSGSYYLIEAYEECTSVAADKTYVTMALVNTGELLTLKDNGGTLIDSANRAGAWFAGLNTGNKPSMERKNPGAAGTSSGNWANNDGVTKNGQTAPYDHDSNPETPNESTAIYGTPKSVNSAYDVTAPTVSSVTLDPTSPVKAGSVTFTIVFDEPMDTAISPTVTFGIVSPYTDRTISQTSYSSATWEGSYTITAGYDGLQHISISGAQDLASTTMATDTTHTFTVDTTPPNAPQNLDLAADDDSGSSSTDNITNHTTVLTFSGTAEAASSVQLYDGGSPVGDPATATGGDWSIDIGLAAGDHSITAKATDAAGNTSIASDPLSVTVDTTAPTADITYSPDHAVKEGDSLTITAAFDEPMADSPVTTIAISGANTLGATGMTKTDTTHYYYNHTVGAGNGTATVALGAGTDVAGNEITSVPASGPDFTVDNTAPAADITYSPDHAVKEGDSLTITAAFDEPMADSPVTEIAISGENTQAATVMTKTSTTEYYYNHTVGAGDGTATVALSVGTDVAGNEITSVPTSGPDFTVDNTAPEVSTYNPANGATAVARDTNLVLTFDETGGMVKGTTGNIVIYDSDDNEFETIPVGDAKVSIDDNVVTINPGGTFAKEINYYVQIAATCFDDTAGNSYAGIGDKTTWNFTTTNAWTQTDWVGGSGQFAWDDDTCYYQGTNVDHSTTGEANLEGTPTGGQLLLNQGFETGTVGQVPTNWSNVGAGSPAPPPTKSADQQHSPSSYSCKLDNPTSGYTGRGIQSDEVDVIAGYGYSFKLWGYVVNAGAGVITDSDIYSQIFWYDDTHTYISNTTLPAWRPSDFGIWGPKTSSTYPAPANAVYARLNIRVQERLPAIDNDIYIDDTEFIPPYDYTYQNGTLTSSVYDAGATGAIWGIINWDCTTPTDTTVTVKVRTDTTSPLTTAWSTATSGNDITELTGVTDNDRYIQYRVELSTTDAPTTPTFEDITIEYVEGEGEEEPETVTITITNWRELY